MISKKHLNTVLCFFLLTAFTTSEPQKIWIDKAISSNTITAKFVHNDNSVHYEKPVKAILTNNSSEAIVIGIPVGMVFTADNDEEQDIVVTRMQMAMLDPGATKEVPFYGNCMESDDACGDEESSYTLKGRADEKLFKLVEYISKNKVGASLGQKAVWTLIDKDGLENIYDKDREDAENLRKYVSTLTGKPLPNPEAFSSYAYDYEAEPLIAVKGIINLKFSEDCKLEIAMFDNEGRMVRELFRYERLAKGPHRLTYQFDNSVYTDKEYEIKVIRDSKVIYTRTVDLS